MEKGGLGLEITELRLGLPGTEKMMKKRGFTEMIMTSSGSNSDQCESGVVSSGGDVEKINEPPVAKSQVVGWPPVCSYRRKNNCKEAWTTKVGLGYVKVSMDGVPYLRKMDLGSSQGYDDLAFALDKLFGVRGIG